MFRKKRTVINGIEFPEDFDVSSVINNIAISNDGRYAAVTKAGDVVIADIPENGKMKLMEQLLIIKKELEEAE